MRNELNESVVLSISKEELREMMERAVQRGLEDAGLYIEDAKQREAARDDFRFLRRLRLAADGVAAKVGYTVLAIMTGGLLFVIWAGIKVHVLKQ